MSSILRSRGQSLGIDAQRRELEELQKQRDQIDKRERRLRAGQRAVLRGTTVEEELEQTYYRQDGVVENAVNSRARAVEDSSPWWLASVLSSLPRVWRSYSDQEQNRPGSL